MIKQQPLKAQFFNVLLLLLTISSHALGVEHAFQFTAQVLFVGEDEPGVPATPFGHVVPPFSFINGGFVYETNTSDSFSIDGCDCTGYRHRQINGFRIQFAAFGLQADEYLVEVRNDVELHGYMDTVDMISWVYPGIMGPELDTPLLVANTLYNSGFLRADLIAPNTLFSDSSLPTGINPNSFLIQNSFNPLGDEMPPGQPDVIYNLLSLEAVSSFASDHDLDGDVDGRDFLIWQRYSDIDSNNGDANSDLVVDGSDLEIWQAQYGSNTMSFATSTAIPEPSSMIMIGCFVIAFSTRQVSLDV